MEHPYRELAPITASAWAEIEKDAQRMLKTIYTARRLVDFVLCSSTWRRALPSGCSHHRPCCRWRSRTRNSGAKLRRGGFIPSPIGAHRDLVQRACVVRRYQAIAHVAYHQRGIA
jgi:hypothetical protein